MKKTRGQRANRPEAHQPARDLQRRKAAHGIRAPPLPEEQVQLPREARRCHWVSITMIRLTKFTTWNKKTLVLSWKKISWRQKSWKCEQNWEELKNSWKRSEELNRDLRICYQLRYIDNWMMKSAKWLRRTKEWLIGTKSYELSKKSLELEQSRRKLRSISSATSRGNFRILAWNRVIKISANWSKT